MSDIQTLADIEAIKQLTARYNRTSDEGDIEAWLDCYTPDGWFGRSNTTRRFEGREGLIELDASNDVSSRHVTTDHIIEVDGDAATQTCYLLFLDRKNGFLPAMFGTYEDKLRKIDGRWYFTERMLLVDGAGS
jgi:hypothetical protein